MKARTALPLGVLLAALLACRLPSLPAPTPVLPAAPTPVPTPLLPPTAASDGFPFDIHWDDRTLFASLLTSPHQEALAALPGASVYHIALTLSDPPTRIPGILEVRYTNQETVPLGEIVFALFPEILGGEITVGAVALDGQPAASTHETGLLRLPLSAPLQPGESVVVSLEFEVGVPAQGGGYYYGIFGYNEGILSLAHACPTILVYDQRGWNDQPPDVDGDPLFSDASFYLVSVDAPRDLRLVASGVEIGRSETADRQRVRYANGPARDFYLAAGRGLVRSSRLVGETVVNSYAPPRLGVQSRLALETAEAALRIFGERYGPYPYTEFDLVSISTSAGGVEYPGLAALALSVYPGAEFLEIVVAHEVGHQWFYNLVGNDTQGQPWLDESLVQFATWEYFSDRYGPQGEQAFRDNLAGTWYSGAEVPIGQPVSAYTAYEYGEIVYGRGAFFFEALRDRMGRAAFDELMRAYVEAYAWEIATAEDFKALAEEHCNCDLTPVFEEWVYP